MEFFNLLSSILRLNSIENIYLRATIALVFTGVLIVFVRAFFRRFASRLVKNTETEIDDKLFKATQPPLILIILITGFFFVLNILNVGMTETTDKVFYSFIGLFSLYLLSSILVIIVHGVRATHRGGNLKVFDNKIFPFFERFIKIFIGITVLFFLLKLWKIDVTPLLASAGIAGIAIAFAAQETIANLFGGVSIFLDKTYEIGDYVIVDNNERGEVVDIGMRSTKIRTRDDVLVTIPNSLMANSKVVNESGGLPKLRIKIPLDVAYDCDVEKVEKTLVELAKKKDFVQKKPEPQVRFRTFNNYSIALELQYWIKRPEKKGITTHYMIKEIYKTFHKKGIEFPYPRQDILVKKEK